MKTGCDTSPEGDGCRCIVVIRVFKNENGRVISPARVGRFRASALFADLETNIVVNLASPQAEIGESVVRKRTQIVGCTVSLLPPIKLIEDRHDLSPFLICCLYVVTYCGIGCLNCLGSISQAAMLNLGLQRREPAGVV